VYKGALDQDELYVKIEHFYKYMLSFIDPCLEKNCL